MILYLLCCRLYLLMAILERKIVHGAESSFSHVVYPRFVLPRHRHAEFELMIFTAGSGKQFVGGGTADYEAGDMALIGSGIPHLHLCDTILDGGDAVPSAGEALHFPPALFPADMDVLPEYARISQLLRKSRYGLRFRDRVLSGRVLEMMRETDGCDGIRRFVQLLSILDILAKSSDFVLLSDAEYQIDNEVVFGNDPIGRVYTYLADHFREPVELGKAAAYAGMNPASLCRAFRRRTDKSIFRYLTEMRVEYACKLLAHSKQTVSQIAYESGYNNLSHFNRQFRAVTHRTPSDYRRQINADLGLL